MALIVQKYGGTSVGTTERIKAVATRVKRFVARGDQVVVVVSAMSGETNRLMALANDMAKSPSARELDVLLSTGEQVTIALLAMALHAESIEACSYTGSQVRILTDDTHGKARIKSIDDKSMRHDLKEGRVVVVAGFQGSDDDLRCFPLDSSLPNSDADFLDSSLPNSDADFLGAGLASMTSSMTASTRAALIFLLLRFSFLDSSFFSSEDLEGDRLPDLDPPDDFLDGLEASPIDDCLGDDLFTEPTDDAPAKT